MASDLDLVMRDISDIKAGMLAHFKDDKEAFNALNTKMDTVIEKLETKYASKWVETAVTYALYTVASVIIVAVMSLVIIRAS